MREERVGEGRPDRKPERKRAAAATESKTPTGWDTRPQSPRVRYELDDRGFDEVPRKYRKFYRRWQGPDDLLAPNEALCPVCKIVIRSPRELRVGDRVYCMACMTRLVVVLGEDGRLEAETIY